MSSNSRKILISMFLATFACGLVIWSIYKSSFVQSSHLVIPKANWEKIYFKYINQTTQLAKMKELRKTDFAKNDLEIRIWRGFGLSDLEGITFNKINNEWSAFHIRANHYIEPTNAKVTKLNTPKSGWETFWNKITGLGILTFPDSFEINCNNTGIDGMSYVIEYQHNKVYRTYMYSMNFSNCDEAKQVEKIGEIVAEEFDNGEGTCKTTEWIPCARFLREKETK